MKQRFMWCAHTEINNKQGNLEYVPSHYNGTFVDCVLYLGTGMLYLKLYHKTHTALSTMNVNSPFKPWCLINFMVHNHLGSNGERVEIETINLLIWIGKLAHV